MSIQQEKFTAIANKIREKTGTTELIKPSDFANKIDDVYDAGKKSQYDEFWDNLQQNGTRLDYTGGFCHWNTNLFKPKYDMKPSNATYMLSHFQDEIDLVECLNNLGITLDFSDCTNFTNFMLWSQINRVGVIDSTASSAVSFYYAYLLHTIDLLIIKDDGSNSLNFNGCGRLKNIRIEGVIGKTTNMQESPLSKKSIINVISVLSNSTTNLTLTLSQSAVNTEIPNEEWESLIATKPNWTISLI